MTSGRRYFSAVLMSGIVANRRRYLAEEHMRFTLLVARLAESPNRSKAALNCRYCGLASSAGWFTNSFNAAMVASNSRLSVWTSMAATCEFAAAESLFWYPVVWQPARQTAATANAVAGSAPNQFVDFLFVIIFWILVGGLLSRRSR